MHSNPEWYDFELDKISKNIAEVKPSKILVQLPNGMKKYYPIIRDFLEPKLDVEVCLSASPCYGGCDVSECEARIVGADLILHFGHTRYYFEKFPTIYVPARSMVEFGEDIVREAVREILDRGFRSVGLSATVQHVHQIPRLKNFLESEGLKVHVFKPKSRIQVEFEGQIIGCNYSAALAVDDIVDVHLVLCGGLFHPLGLALSTRKPVLKLDPYRLEVEDVTLEAEKTMRVRYGKIMEALDASSVGLIIGGKPGQYRPRLVGKILELAKYRKVRVEKIVLDEVTVEKLRNLSLEVEAWIVTSCPRLPIDDLWRFEVPVLTPGEAYMVFKGELETYKFPYF